MMTSIPDHTAVRGETKIEPQVTQTNLPPITGTTMPLYSSSVQPGMETTGFTAPLREHRFGNSVWQPATAAPPDPTSTWTPQGQFIQQIPPSQIEEIRYPQYAVAGYPQATPVVGYQQNAFMQTNGNLYNGTPQPQPSPHSMHNGNSRSTPTLNGNMEYVEQSPRSTEYMNGTYPHSNQADVMAPPTSSTPTSRCGSAQLENGEGKYTNPPTPTTPSNQGNAMPGYPLQIPPQSVQSSRNSSGYPGQVSETTERGNGENSKVINSDKKELWSSSPRPLENKDDSERLDNHQMHKNNDSWSDSRNNPSDGSRGVWSSGANEVPTSQHQQQETWRMSPQQTNESLQQHQQQQQPQQAQMHEVQQQRYLQHQMNPSQHPQKSPQMSHEDQQGGLRQQPSPQIHQSQNQHVHMQHQQQQQHSPLMSPRQMQQAQMHHQHPQSQQVAQMQHQKSQTQQQHEQMQQQLIQRHQQQQAQMHHQQSQQQQQQQQQQQPLHIQPQQSHGQLHHQQLPSPVHHQHPHMQASQASHSVMQGHHMAQTPLHMLPHHQQSQMMMSSQGRSPQLREMWSGQPNSRSTSQNPPEPWPNEPAGQQQHSPSQMMWTNEKKPNQGSQFNERAELNNRLKTMILNKQQQEMKKIQDGGHLVYQEQKNLPPVSSGNFLALGHHPRKSVSEGGGCRSRGSLTNERYEDSDIVLNSTKCSANNTNDVVRMVDNLSENYLNRIAPSVASSETQTSSSPFDQTPSLSKRPKRLAPSPALGNFTIKQEPQWDAKCDVSSATEGLPPPSKRPQIANPNWGVPYNFTPRGNEMRSQDLKPPWAPSPGYPRTIGDRANVDVSGGWAMPTVSSNIATLPSWTSSSSYTTTCNSSSIDVKPSWANKSHLSPSRNDNQSQSYSPACNSNDVKPTWSKSTHFSPSPNANQLHNYTTACNSSATDMKPSWAATSHFSPLTTTNQTPSYATCNSPTVDAKPSWAAKPHLSPSPNTIQSSPNNILAVKTEKDVVSGNLLHSSPSEIKRELKVVKEENYYFDESKEYLIDEANIKTEKFPDDLEQFDRLKKDSEVDSPACECFPPDHIPSEPGPYYTHLGYARSLEELRQDTEKRTGLTGKAIRVEKLIFTGKEGKTTSGCPLGKWIIRRSGPEEKVLMLVKNRKGHVCSTAWIVVVIVAWEGVPSQMADDLYSTVTEKLRNYGVVTTRRCGVNEPRTCACQGLDNTTCGASFSFGCSWSMYYNGCKFARSKTARKFKLSVKSEEPIMEEKLQNLATHISPLYKTMAPDSFVNQTKYEDVAGDCRLGLKPGRPWSGVTACFDFCAHAHRDIHNMHNGCTTVVTLTKHRGFEKPEDEQLHVLPMYIIEETDEWGSKDAYEEKIKSGAIECLTKYPCEVRTRQAPLESCRKLAKKRKDEREQAKRALALKMNIESSEAKVNSASRKLNKHAVENGFSPDIQRNFLNLHSTPEKRCKTEGDFYNQSHSEGCQSEVDSGLSSQYSPSCTSASPYPMSPFRSPLRVVTQSPGPPYMYPSPTTPDLPNGKIDRAFSPVGSPNTVFRRPIGRPPSRSSNPATPMPTMDSTYLKPSSDKHGSPYAQGAEMDRFFPHSPFSPYIQSPTHSMQYSPGASRDYSSPNTYPTKVPTPMKPAYAPRNFFDFHSAPTSPISAALSPSRPHSTFSSVEDRSTPCTPWLNKRASVSTQCSPSKSPLSSTLQHPVSPCPSPSSGYWSSSSQFSRDSFTPSDQSIGFSPPKWTPHSRYSSFSSPQSVYSSGTTPLPSPQSLPSFQNLRCKKSPVQPGIGWRNYPDTGVPHFNQEHNWKMLSCPNPVGSYYSPSSSPSYQPNHRERTPYLEHLPVKQEPTPDSPVKQENMNSTPPPPWSTNETLQAKRIDPQNLLGSVTDFTYNEESFSDPNVGGVAIALCHGAVLFEVAKHELHATTALKNPNRFHPTRISLVFYQHRNLNKPDHGRGEWKEKQRCKKERADKYASTLLPTSSSVSTQSLDVQTEPQYFGPGPVNPIPYNYFPMSSPSLIHHSSPVGLNSSPSHSHIDASPSSFPMTPVPKPSAWGNLFPLHPSIVQGPYQESETLG